MKYTFFETENGLKVKTAEFDGYAIAERLLEGVMFQVTIQDDGTLYVDVREQDKDYFSQFNTSKFLEEAKKYAEENDVFTDPVSGEDCWFEEPVSSSNTKKTATAIPVANTAPRPAVVQQSSMDEIADMMGVPRAIQDVMARAGTVIGIGPGGGSMTLGVDSNGQFGMDIGEVEPEKPKVFGKYTSKLKYIDFIGTVGNINALAKTAYLEGKYLSGLDMDHKKFKITICDDHTFDFEDVDGTSTEAELLRYISIIDDSTVSGFRDRSVASDFRFVVKHTLKEKEVEIESYLVVEAVKPYNSLLDFFEEEDEEEGFEPEVDIAEKYGNSDVASKLAGLFDDDDDVVIDSNEPPVPNIVAVVKPELTGSKAMIMEEFLEAKREKQAQLTKLLENQKKELSTAKNSQALAFRKIQECHGEIKLLDSRIDSLEVDEDFNGYFFLVSEAMSPKCILDEETNQLITRKLISMNFPNAESFTTLFNNDIYHIRFGLEVDGEVTELTNFKNITPILDKIAIDYENNAKFTFDGNKLVYEGQLEWSRLNNKLTRVGFRNDTRFDEYCAPKEPLPLPNLANYYKDGGYNSEEENVSTSIEDFNTKNGYDIGSDFYMAITYKPDAANEITTPIVTITPKSYFDKEGLQYEGRLHGILREKLPTIKTLDSSLQETSDGEFVLLDQNTSTPVALDAITTLLKVGLTFSRDFQNLVSAENTRLISNAVLQYTLD